MPVLVFAACLCANVCAQTTANETMFNFTLNWNPGVSTDPWEVDDLLRFLETSSIEPVVSEDAVIVGDTLDLIDSSTDELVFDVPTGATPGFEVGDIVIGDPDNPYFGRVMGIAMNGNTATVQTGTATLAEAVQQGNLTTSLVFVPGATKGLSLPQDKGLGSIELSPLIWDDTLTISESGVSATIVGEASITPRVELKLKLDHGLDYFRAEVIGNLGINLDIQLQANLAYDDEPLEWEVARWDQVFVQAIGVVPVWEQVTFRLVAGIELDANAAASFETRAWAHTTIHLGGDYDRDRPDDLPPS